jgi:hypothetical protein
MPQSRSARFLATVVLTLSTLLAVVVGDVSAAHAGPIINGYFTFTFQNKNSGLCLEIDNWNTADFTSATQNVCSGGANQEWFRNAYAPGEQLRNVNSRKCLGIAYGSNANFASAVQNPCDTSSSQFWHPNSTGCACIVSLVNGLSGKCLDVKEWNTHGDAAIQQFDCHGGANQLWVVNSHYHPNAPLPLSGQVALCSKALCP